MLSIVPLNLQPPLSSTAGCVGLDPVAANLQGDEADKDTLLRLSAWVSQAGAWTWVLQG